MASEEQPEVVAPDDISALFRFLSDKLNPDDLNQVEQLVENILDAADDDDDDGPAEDKRRFRRLGARPSIGILADKRKTVGDSMIDRETIREIQALRQAEAETGIVGKASVGAVYRTALRQMGKDATGMDAAAARATYRALRSAPHARSRAAADSRAVASRAVMFPHGDRLLKSSF